jgi:hypothetical protein
VEKKEDNMRPSLRESEIVHGLQKRSLTFHTNSLEIQTIEERD